MRIYGKMTLWMEMDFYGKGKNLYSYIKWYKGFDDYRDKKILSFGSITKENCVSRIKAIQKRKDLFHFVPKD